VITTDSPCRFLEWDSEFFGRRIARVTAAEITGEEMERIRRWAQAEAIDCLYYLADANDTDSIRVVEDAGFRITDVRITRERSLDGERGELPEDVDFFREEDVPALGAIASSSHGTSRFYHDHHFSRERCDALYRTWIANACAGRADCVLVVRREGRAVGYMTCVIESPTTGSLGLGAVSTAERGRSLGERLSRGAIRWFANSDLERVRVVSQARNVEASRLWERLGFQTLSVEHWYHLWLPGGERA
jgi:dTDP-4-amino-4,6-dideoxy-D-galactose acyltransferase